MSDTTPHLAPSLVVQLSRSSLERLAKQAGLTIEPKTSNEQLAVRLVREADVLITARKRERAFGT